MLKKKYLILIFLLFSVFSTLSSEGVLARPRKIYVIQTEHFDILFPKDSAAAANLLAENADALYEKAKFKVDYKYDVRIPVVLSPDSDKLFVSYTAHPYNRILIFDGVPEAASVGKGETLLNLFYRELTVCMISSIRSPIHQYISTIVGDSSYRPVSALNLPFSFIEGRADLEQNDKLNLQRLIQAKIEKKFPSLIQASVAYDVYPGNDLIIAANSAFSAYLIQSYGYEKYALLWEECGTVHPFLMDGIFYKVYGTSVAKLWKEFELSIPLPEDYEEILLLEKSVTKVFENDTEGLYEQIIASNYGIVWYDAIRHEVDILDRNNKTIPRQLLFLANDINRITLSPDGRYLVISYIQIKTEDAFKREAVWIYDLKEREFVDDFDFSLREGSIILKDNANAIAGINVQNKIAKLQVWDWPEDPDDTQIIYEKTFERNLVPSSILYAGNNKISYLLSSDENQWLCFLDIVTNEEARFQLFTSDSEQIHVSRIYPVKSENHTYIFEYEINNSFSRIGYILMNENYYPEKILLQKTDIPGGIYYPAFENDNLYFISKKYSHNEFCYIPYAELKCVEAEIYEVESFEENPVLLPEINFDTERLNEYELSRYMPFKYMIPVSILPFLPIRNITIEKGAEKWPGLGLSMNTHSDPFMNNKITLSAGWNFLNMEFTKIFNGSDRLIKEMIHKDSVTEKDKSFAAYVENTSTPVDIKAGAIFKYNLLGEYDFKAVAGTNWQIPLGMNFSNLHFDIESIYSASTDYYDPDYVHINESLENWPSFNDAYQLAEFSLSAEYSNIHQYGYSPYEKRGLSFGARIYSLWDLYEYDLLNKKRDLVLKELEEKGEQSELTKAQIDEMYNENLLQISQLAAGAFARIEIPRLTPLHMKNGWVLSVPATITAEFLNSTGTALEANAEALLIGKEIHYGSSLLKLYFGRIGLKSGYNFRLNYDTAEVARPDVRRRETIGTVLNNVSLDDNVYLILNMDLSSPLGALSSNIFSTNFKFSYYPRTTALVFNFSITASF